MTRPDQFDHAAKRLVGVGGGGRHMDLEARSGTRRRVDRVPTADVAEALAHADEPEATAGMGRVRLEARPGVGDPEDDFVLVFPELDPGLFRAAVA